VLRQELETSLRSLITEEIPLPGAGKTQQRHRRLAAVGREDLSLARLAEAHWDAVAILAEAGRKPEPNTVYGVWASEKRDQPLSLERQGNAFQVSGTKMFCTGAGIVDRALVTVVIPEPRLVDVDLRAQADAVHFDDSDWNTSAFRETRTATVTFEKLVASREDLIGEPGWYLHRPGFWHGACGPAACWAGGAIALVDYANRQSRNDPHTLAHLGAMNGSAWALWSYLDAAGREIDASPNNQELALIRALTVRHLVEQACTDILRRLARAYGPYPLATNENIARRYHELDLYLRQSHAERDLEAVGRALSATNCGS
jgi:hypothetical protein